MKLVDQGIVYDGGQRPNRQSCAFPGICITPGGRWLCSFRAAPTKAATAGQHVVLCHSDDEGRTWSSPEEPFIAPQADGPLGGTLRTGHVTTLGDGRLLSVLSWVELPSDARPFFNEQTEGLLDTRICISFSEDEGRHWSPAQFMTPRPFMVPSPTTGPVVCLDGKDLICQVELNKLYDDPEPWRHQSMLIFSRDGGDSWGEQCAVSDDPTRRIFYWDQRLGNLDDDVLLDVFWTFDREAGQYLNIHARCSHDGGRQWSTMWDTGVPGQPAAPVRLDDGRIALVYVDRTATPCIKLRTSRDEGQTWPEGTETVVFESSRPRATAASQSMQEAWDEMYAFSLGLPATAKLPGGDVLVVFYEGPSGDRTSIRWARISPEI